MTKKSTKRALLSSVLVLIVCIAMLIGTTFAWFTDNVSSANNIIKSGNLDVELEYSTDKMATWSSVNANTNVFKNELWEPGHTEVVYLRVSNLGSLALKYKLGVNVISEVTSETEKGDTIKLSDIIEFGVINNVSTPFAEREDAVKAVTSAQKVSAGYNSGEKTLLKDAAPDVVAMVVYMPTSVKNEANHATGKVAPQITLGLNVVATQYTAESDSFNNLYDEYAMYPGEVGSASELIDALTNNKSVKLGKDIDLSGTEWTPIATYSGVLDGNGYAIKNLSGANGLFTKISGATIKNLDLENVAITGTDNRVGAIAGQIDKVADAPQTVIENVTVSGVVAGASHYTGGFVGADRSYDTLFVDCVNNANVTGGHQVGGIVGQANRLTVFDNCVNNGDVTASTIMAGGIVGLVAGDDNNTNLNVTIKNCENKGTVTQTGTSYTNLAGGMAGAVGRDGGDAIVNEIKAYILDCTVLSGEKLYGAKYNYCSGKDEKITVVEGKEIVDGVYEQGTRNYYVSDAQGLVNVYTKVMPQNHEQSQSVNLMSDIDMSGIVWEPIDNMHHTLNGNGHTISNLTCLEGWRSGLFAYAGGVIINDLTLENVTSTGSQAGTFAGSGEGLTMNNCYLKGNNVVSYYATTETWGGIGAITGVISGSTINAEIVDGATVIINDNGMVTNCQYYDDLTGYLSANNGTVVNNGLVKKVNTVSTTAAAQDALDNANPGSVIKLAAGNYGKLTIKNFWGGNYTQTGVEPITIKGGNGVNVEAIDLNGMNFVTIEDITFDSAKAVEVYNNGGATGDYGNIVDSANDESKSRGANHITVKNCVFTGTPAVDIGKYCSINFMGKNPSSWTYDITVSSCKFLTNAQNFIRMNNVTGKGFVLIEGNTFGGDAYITNHHAINASANAGDWTIKGNTFTNWNPKKCAFATGYQGEAGDVADFVITGNTFSNTRIPTAADGDDGVIEIKTNSYDATKYTLDFSGNTFAGALAGLDETTIKYVKP